MTPDEKSFAEAIEMRIIRGATTGRTIEEMSPEEMKPGETITGRTDADETANLDERTCLGEKRILDETATTGVSTRKTEPSTISETTRNARITGEKAEETMFEMSTGRRAGKMKIEMTTAERARKTKMTTGARKMEIETTIVERVGETKIESERRKEETIEEDRIFKVCSDLVPSLDLHSFVFELHVIVTTVTDCRAKLAAISVTPRAL